MGKPRYGMERNDAYFVSKRRRESKLIKDIYFHGKIYYIFSKKLPNLLYIGSTTDTLKGRFGGHKRNPTNDNMRKFMSKYDDIVIELVEEYPCVSRQQLDSREQFHMNDFKCKGKLLLNYLGACRTIYPDLKHHTVLDMYALSYPHWEKVIEVIFKRDYHEIYTNRQNFAKVMNDIVQLSSSV